MFQSQQTIQNNHSVEEMETFIANLFSSPEPLSSSTAVAVQGLQDNQSPTPSRSCESSPNNPIKMLEFCKEIYFLALADQYDLKSGLGESAIKFLLKDDLVKTLTEAEHQTMEFWDAHHRNEEDGWKENKNRLRKFISEAKSQVQTKNTTNFALYDTRFRNNMSGKLKKIAETFYHSICSGNPEPLENATGKDCCRKFYDHDNLKKTVSSVVSHMIKSCVQYKSKWNPLYENGVETDLIFDQVKVQAHTWGEDLVNRNYKYKTAMENYVETSIISKFESEPHTQIQKILVEKQPSDLTLTKERIRDIIQGCMNPYLEQVDQICKEFAVENCQQLVEKYNQDLDNTKEQLCEEAVGKWRTNCTTLLKSHHDKMKQKICVKSTSTPQFVLDIYEKHLELAKKEAEENILGTQEQPSFSVVAEYESQSNEDVENVSTFQALTPKTATTTPQRTCFKRNANNLAVQLSKQGQNGQHGSPNTTTSSAATTRCHNGDGGQSNKRRKP